MCFGEDLAQPPFSWSLWLASALSSATFTFDSTCSRVSKTILPCFRNSKQRTDKLKNSKNAFKTSKTKTSISTGRFLTSHRPNRPISAEKTTQNYQNCPTENSCSASKKKPINCKHWPKPKKPASLNCKNSPKTELPRSMRFLQLCPLLTKTYVSSPADSAIAETPSITPPLSTPEWTSPPQWAPKFTQPQTELFR